MAFYRDISQTIGNTPLTELKRYAKKHRLNAKIFAKLEYFNPAGSVKDRVARAMIENAEEKGLLKKNAVIVEPTSGNTGIGLASVAAAKGYRVILTMPETMSAERTSMLKAYGAEIVLTEGAKGMKGAVEKANALAEKTEGGIILNQFDNPANPAVHYQTTGPEIWKDTAGKADIFVAGVGTGGTVTGVGKYLKAQNPGIKVVAVEPSGSPVLSGGKAGTHKIQGIGAGFIPAVLDCSMIDEVLAVSDEEAFAAGREIGRTEGFLAGISSGAALYAATVLAKRKENAGKTIVVIFPDSGDRYFSTPLFS